MRDSENIEKGLLVREGEEEDRGLLTWVVLMEEVKRVGYIGGPMVAVNFSQYFLQVISIMMVGHLGELALSSTAITFSICGVTGYSLVFGMSSALETICGQAYGAQQYQTLGTQIYTAILCLSLVCIPISMMWIYMGKLLALMGQDPLVSQEAGRYAICLIPSLFGYATLQSVVRYFQVQSLTGPLFVSSLATFCFHVGFCWVLVFKSELGNVGAAVALSGSYWLNVMLLGLYMMFSPNCDKTRVPISMELFHGVRKFFRFAIPSAVMICLEWWSFELIILLSGFLPNSKLETSVLSVCLQCLSTLHMIADGLGGAVSTRVSNELGAGNPRKARMAVIAVMFLTVAQSMILSSILFASKHAFGYAFSNEKEVVDYVSAMAPLLCISVILDSLQGVLSGVARGCGWQDLGAYVNLAAFYLCGIPVAAVLGFRSQLRGKGFWIGVQIGALLQTLLLFIITSCTNWEKQARKARMMMFDGKSSVHDELM
ncbi:protein DETOXIFICATION 14-like [Tripterygium wilfordii]|uniref:protein DETOXIFICATION 14-like n=1 Tax=Tripterygium wilfordii TaxID=458696 RepID=UPI0018F81FB3|nr:protein DETOXIFICATION 14-like [Tripterygium wilfordii]